MKKISSKIVAIFILIFINLFITVIASVVAVDTQQHIAITEIVADQRINIGQVVNLTDTMARVYIASENKPEGLDVFKEKVENASNHIDLIVDNLYQKNYKLIDGTDYKL
ncbi:MAG: hypothetical protein IBX70_13060 [Clostridia bacterium]|nr:hypothetical protein [Clostridia bacterium]